MKTLRLSHAGAFELVRQALAACPDRQTNHPYNRHILEYLQSLGGSVDAAKLGQLEEMISYWRGRKYKVPKDVREALLYHDKSKWGQLGGHEPETDVFLFVLGCSLAAATTAPFLWWFFALSALGAAGSRAVAMISGLAKQQKLRDYLTKSAAPELQTDADKFTAPQLKLLFEWITAFLSKAWTHALQAAYTMPDRRLEVRVAYSDDLKGPDDAERIRGEMHKLVEDFARMPREQRPSAASLDAEFGLGAATGGCLKGFKAPPRLGSFRVAKKNGTMVQMQGVAEKEYTVYQNKDPTKTLAIFRTNYGGMYSRDYPALIVNAVKVQHFPPPPGKKTGKFRFKVDAQIKRTPFGEHESLGGKVPIVKLEVLNDEGKGAEPAWDVGSQQCLDLNAFSSKFGNPTAPQWRLYMDAKGSLLKDPDTAKKSSAAKHGWEDLRAELEFFVWNLAKKLHVNAR